MKKFKFNIKHKQAGKVHVINFKSKDALIRFLDNNVDKINKLVSPVINFNQVTLPLKQTVWGYPNES
jgi:hypothetical protein